MDVNRLCLRCVNGEIGENHICTSCGNVPIVSQSPSYALPLGTIIHGRYLIGRVLGEGGFGITYISYDLAEKRRVVLKELFPCFMVQRKPGTTNVLVKNNPASFNKNRDRFIQEAQLIYTFRDTPEIVDVFHIFTENNTGYYAMEFLNGQTLQSMLKAEGNRLTWNRLVPVAQDIIKALSVVHKAGSIHRDISPDNIFLSANGKAKLIDFGAARHFDSGQQMTQIIKKGFAPWEQYRRGVKQGPWTDIYALAATFYVCLSGKLPPESVDRIVNDTLRPLSSMGVNVPQNVDEAITRALQLKPECRFQNIEAFAAALGLQAGRNFSAAKWSLRCVSGIYKGMVFSSKTSITLGRDSSKCSIVFPSNMPGISAVHATFLFGNTPSFPGIRCDSGTQGIYINGVAYFGKGRIFKLQQGDRVSFGSEEVFIIERQ